VHLLILLNLRIYQNLNFENDVSFANFLSSAIIQIISHFPLVSKITKKCKTHRIKTLQTGQFRI